MGPKKDHQWLIGTDRDRYQQWPTVANRGQQGPTGAKRGPTGTDMCQEVPIGANRDQHGPIELQSQLVPKFHGPNAPCSQILMVSGLSEIKEKNSLQAKLDLKPVLSLAKV
jgi:hypothetical protein